MCVQLGTLGAGNHYAEIQVVDEIYNDYAAKKMGIDHKGQVCVMIHSGSRGLGHQVATGGSTHWQDDRFLVQLLLFYWTECEEWEELGPVSLGLQIVVATMT